ncbi:hypothetical protein VB737_02770 [Synechococcus sp. BA-120 BA3]|nr:hypothetical protein [Synechococcus sp. BA-120 BA3]
MACTFSASDEDCLDRIAWRHCERPPGSHHLSEDNFWHIALFFQPPQEAEVFNVKLYAMKNPWRRYHVSVEG